LEGIFHPSSHEVQREQTLAEGRIVHPRRLVCRLAAVAVLVVPAVAHAQARPYDIVIVNGRVIDPESGLDAVRSVGIRAGKIAADTMSGLTVIPS